MASVQKIVGVKGVSYKLTAYCGYDSEKRQIRKTKTWKPVKGMTTRQAEKNAALEAAKFEEAVNRGITAYDGKIRFSEYATVWLANSRLAYKTYERYSELLVRINDEIGHLRLESIQAHHLEAFYKQLSENGMKDKGRYASSQNLPDVLKDREIAHRALAKSAGIAASTVGLACKGKRVSVKCAEQICEALEMPMGKLFKLYQGTEGLSDKTVMHHHRLISAILAKAKRERLIPYNVAAEHATAPKVQRKEAKYLDDVQARELVMLLLEEEDIRIKTSILLMLYSGVRRGELCGLSWGDVDESIGVIHVMRSSQYQKESGVVEVSTKNESSRRPIKLPPIVFEVLDEYRVWWLDMKKISGKQWRGEANRLFIQDDGRPINPDSINYWLEKFIKRHKLEKFTPHSLRHTFTTLQLMAGVDIRTLQARTGHAQASTLTNIYAHSIKTAAEAAADTLDHILMPNSDPKDKH